MKKLLLIITFLTASAFAQSPATVTVNLRSTLGPALSGNTYIVIRLRNFAGYVPRVIGTGAVVRVDSGPIKPDGSGLVTTTAWENSQITPSGTFYTVEFWDQGRMTSTANWLINSTPFDLDSQAPIVSPPIPFQGIVVLQNPFPGQNQTIQQQTGTTFTFGGAGAFDWTGANLTMPQKADLVAGFVPTTELGSGPGGTGTLCLTDTSPATWASCAGISSGDLKSSPTTNQFVKQPTVAGVKTSFNPNVDNNVVDLNTADTTLNWVQSPVSPSSLAASSNVVTLAPCPKGLTTKDHYVYVAGTGTPELAKLTAVSCTADATSGTVTFTTTGTHAVGYTVSTASSGLKEASEYAAARATNTKGGLVEVSPAAVLTLHGQVDIEVSNQTIDTQNAEIDILADYATYQCGLYIGNPANTNAVTGVFLKNLTGLRPMIAQAGGLCLDAQGTVIDWLGPMAPPDSSTWWEHFLVSKNDQSTFIMDLNNIGSNVGFGTGKCTTTDCSSFIYGVGGGNAGILHISYLNLQLNNLANGVDNTNNNSITIDGCIIQNIAQWGIRSGESFPDNKNLTLPNGCYFEGVGAANPTGLGGAGIILKGGESFIGVGNLIGLLPKFANTGATPYYFWVVPKNASAQAGSPLLAGYATLTTTGTYSVNWYDVSPGGTYDVIRWQTNGAGAAPTTNTCGGGSVSACGSIATALAEASVCDPTTHICTFTDDITASTTAYTVATPIFAPVIDFWPSIVTVGPNVATTSATNNGKVQFSFMAANDVIHGGFINAFGSTSSAFSALRCGGNTGDWSSTAVSCLSFPSNIPGALWLRPQIPGGSGQQGVISFALPPGSSVLQSTDLITLKSADPQLTFAFPWLRPAWQSGDSAFGMSSSTIVGAYARDANAFSIFLNELPDSTPAFRFTANGFESQENSTTGRSGYDICNGDSTAHAITCSFNADTAKSITRVIASGNSTLGNTSIGAGACAATVTTGATGTATTDGVEWAFATAPTTADGLLNYSQYVTAGNVNWKVCNTSAGAIVPTGLVINWKVIR